MSQPRPGFYIAWGKWLDVEFGPRMLFKVGHTGDLRARLHDDCYVTGFPPGHWRYLHTLETKTKSEAHRIEAAVLYLFGAERLGPRELVRAGFDELCRAAAESARRLSIAAEPRDNPVYPRAGRALNGKRAASGADGSQNGSQDCSQVLEAAALAKLAGVRTALVADAPAARPAGPPLDAKGGAGAAAGSAAEFADELLDGGDADDIYADEFVPEARAYQTEAVSRCIAELGATGRTTLQVACRCGKTKIAHDVIRSEEGTRVLFLVPGLALLRQTARKLDMYGATGRLLLVGSDPRPYRPFKNLQLAAPQTTDPEVIRDAMSGDGQLLVVSTYQSSQLLPDAFDLIVFDEVHRVCGGAAPRPFNHVLLKFRRGRRLYMTATPNLVGEISMKDRELFGGIAFTYRLRQGIDAGYVNPFRVTILGGGSDVSMARRVASAFSQPGVTKLLVFCRSIRHASELLRETEPLVGQAACIAAHSKMSRSELGSAVATFTEEGRSAILFNCRLFQEGVEFPGLNGVFFASPRHSPRDVIQSLCRPLNVVAGKPASHVFIPAEIDGDAAPEDTKNLKKFQTIVPIFDALLSEDERLYGHLFDPEGCPYPLEWIDSAAEVAEVSDEKAKRTGATVRYSPAQLLAAVRRSVRRGTGSSERLLRVARVPWDVGFSELERIVRECKRYPKGNDMLVFPGGARLNFGAFYRYVREAYAAWQAGEPQPLEPHQLRDLESLPGWLEFGVSGPYPFDRCLEFLDRWIAEHGSPPMVEINKGGWIGLDASWVERLSGVLTTVNQGDGRDRKKGGVRTPGSGFTLSAEKQRMLDELCAKWGLRWRKDRTPEGSLVEDARGRYSGRPTFIQEAFGRFKREWKDNGKASAFIATHFKDYPVKHFKQELPEVWARRDEIVPPKWRAARPITQN